MKLAIRCWGEIGRQRLATRLNNPFNIAFNILERASQTEIDHDFAQGRMPTTGNRVITAIRGRIGIEIIGCDRGPHKDEVVFEVGSGQ